jgi:hypothetical protein
MRYTIEEKEEKYYSEQREQNKESRVLVVVGVPPTTRPGSRFSASGVLKELE